MRFIDISRLWTCVRQVSFTKMEGSLITDQQTRQVTQGPSETLIPVELAPTPVVLDPAPVVLAPTPVVLAPTPVVLAPTPVPAPAQVPTSVALPKAAAPKKKSTPARFITPLQGIIVKENDRVVFECVIDGTFDRLRHQ